MPRFSARLQLPLGDHIGPKSTGVIKTIDAGVFQNVDDRLPVAVAGALVSHEDAGVFNFNEAVTL